MNISSTCFIVAALSALCGMTLGTVMGLSHDFTLLPVHAHLNLLGWVSMMLFGLFHRGVGASHRRLAWIQVSVSAAGALGLPGGLALILLSGDEAYLPVVIFGTFATLIGMALFVLLVVLDARAMRQWNTTMRVHPNSG
jgi:hypothetical protein